MKISKKGTHNLVIIIFIIFCLGWSFYSYFFPEYNWDMLAYMGCILSLDGIKDIDLIHQQVYKTIIRLPEERFNALTSYNKYRATVSHDSEAYGQQLPPYKSRIIYNYLSYFIYKISGNLIHSTYIPSILAFLIIGLIVIIWVSKYIKDGIILLGAFLLIFPTSFSLEIAKYSSPDALSHLIIISAFYVLLEKKRTHLSSLLLILSIAVRSDNIIIALMAFVIFRFLDRKIRISTYHLISYSVFSLALYFGINAWYGNYGWNTLIYFDFIELLPKPHEFAGHVSFTQYLKLFGNIVFITKSYYVIFLSAQIFFFCLWVKSKVNDFENDLIKILVIPNAAFWIHFLLFPKIWDRFFVSHYILIALCLIKLFKTKEKEIGFAQSGGRSLSRASCQKDDRQRTE